MADPIVWVDIPALDLDRAIRFYSAVLSAAVTKQALPGIALGLLPHGEGEIGGCLYLKDGDRPSREGPLVYLNVAGRLDQAVALVEPNGGKVLEAKHPIGPYGFRAIILDSEGNRLALHSPP